MAEIQHWTRPGPFFFFFLVFFYGILFCVTNGTLTSPSLLKLTTLSNSCIQDSECTDSNYFCLNGTCTRLAFTGQFCASHQDCASYSILGNASCTADCQIDSHCGGGTMTALCCTGIPDSLPCNITQEQKAKESMCANGLSCLNTVANTHTCQVLKNSDWVVGVVITILGSMTLNIGLNIQKYAFRINAHETQGPLPPCRMPFWIFGFVIWILGNVANFVALSFAAQSLITALGAVSLVTNFIVAPLLNKEPFGWIDFFSGTLMVAGSVLVVWFANHDNTSRSLCSLLSFYRRPSMITYLSIMILLIFLSWLFINVMETNVQMNHPSLSSLDSNSPALRRLHHQWRVEVFKINRPISKHSRLYKYVLPFLYAGMGGALGGLTVLFAKSSAELITITLSGDNQFVFLPTYLILAAIVVTGIGQVYYINQGLQRYDALLQVPAFYVIYTLCGILSGGVYFDDFKDFKPSQLLFFCIGVGLTFSGVMLLGFRLKKTVALEEALESASGPEEKQLAEHGHRLKVNTSSKQGLQDIDPTLDGWEVLPSSLFPPESPDAPLQPLPPVLNLPKNQKTTLNDNFQEPMNLPNSIPDPDTKFSSHSKSK